MSPLLFSETYAGRGAVADGRLTVLLTIWDRPSFTKRWLKYADQTRFPFLICLADGGTDDEARREIAQNQYEHLAIQFLKFTPDNSYLDYYAKMRIACEQITTKYCVQADNDDFFSTFGLLKCADFLDAHDDYSGCQGEWVGFRLSSEGDYLYSKSILFSKAYTPFYDFSDANGVDRFDAVAKANVQTWYAVTRTEVLLDTLIFAEQCNFGDLFLLELVREFGLLARGKVKCLRVPYYYRQAATATSSNERLLAREGLLHQRMLFSSFCGDLQATKTWLVECLASDDDDRAIIDGRVQAALKRFALAAIESPFRGGRGLSPLYGRVRETLRRCVTSSPIASQFVSRLHSGHSEDVATRRLHHAEQERIRAFMRRGGTLQPESVE